MTREQMRKVVLERVTKTHLCAGRYAPTDRQWWSAGCAVLMPRVSVRARCQANKVPESTQAISQLRGTEAAGVQR